MNKKSRSIFIIVAIAILLAGVTSFAIYKFLSPQRVTIYQFNDNYTAGTAIDENMLRAVQVDAKAISAGTSADVESTFITQNSIKEVLTSGDSLRMDVSEGMPLMLSLLSVTGGSTIEQNLSPNAIAVTVPVSEASSVTNDIAAGTSVNVYSNDGSSTTDLLLEGMRVLAVQKDDNGVVYGVTLEVNKDQSLKLVNAATYATIYLGIVDSSAQESSGEE